MIPYKTNLDWERNNKKMLAREHVNHKTFCLLNNLVQEQKSNRNNMFSDIMEWFAEDPLIFQYSPETKRHALEDTHIAKGQKSSSDQI